MCANDAASAPGPFSKDDPATAFLFAEYDRLTREIEEHNKEAAQCVYYGLTLSGGAWAWLLTHPEIPGGAFSIPLMLSVGFLFRLLLLFESVGLLGDYVRKVETGFLNRTSAAGFGWEQFLVTPVRDNPGTIPRRNRFVGIAHITLLSVLILINGLGMFAAQGWAESQRKNHKTGEILKELEKLEEQIKELKVEELIQKLNSKNA